MADPYAYLVLWVLHRYLVAERSMWEDFHEIEFDGEKITYISVPKGRRYEIIARPVDEAADAHD